jgi:hypothetical protein
MKYRASYELWHDGMENGSRRYRKTQSAMMLRRYETAWSNQSPTAGWSGGTPALLSTVCLRLIRSLSRRTGEGQGEGHFV